MGEPKTIYAFDFDGTLTTRDTLIEFVAFACGRRALVAWLVAHLPLLVLMKLRLVSNHKMKQRLFAHFFGGMAEEDFDILCRRFASERACLLRPEGLATMERAAGESAEIVVVSASVDNWVSPFFSRLGHRVTVLGTKVEVDGGRLTGRFATRNCYGPEKVRRMEEAFPGREGYRVVAFGDSRGDRELLAWADEGHYKPWRGSPSPSLTRGERAGRGKGEADKVCPSCGEPTRSKLSPHGGEMERGFRLFSIFKVRRDERLPAAVAAVVAVALNALFVLKMHAVFTPLRPAAEMQRVMLRHFGVAGYDPLTLITVSSWIDIYNVERHPLLAFLIAPLSLLNSGLARLTGADCALFIAAALMSACAFYSFVFIRRIFTDVMELRRADANLLTVLFASFAYVMVISFTPDHFGFSQCMLLIVLYVAGMRIRKRRAVPTWQMAVLFLFATGITTTNCVKAALMQLVVNGKKFFRPRNLLLGIGVPALLLWGFCKFEHKVFVAPIDKARHEARLKRQAARKAEEARVRKLYAEADSATRAELAKKMVKKRVAPKAGRPISNDGMMRWSDVTTPRWPTIVENLMGEPLQLHSRYLLGDVLRSRPVFVEYEYAANYVAEALAALLFLVGVACGLRSRFLWLALGWFAFDMTLHLGLGFGINEVYIMSPHWLFVLPVAMAFAFRRAGGKPLVALRVAVGCLAAWLLAYNGWQLGGYLLAPAA